MYRSAFSSSSLLQECYDDIQVCFCNILIAPVQAQVFHWQTIKYAEHEALGIFYEEFPEKMDLLIESFQGLTGARMKVHNKPVQLVNRESCEDVKKWAGEVRMSLEEIGRHIHPSYTEVINVLDELKTITDQLLYRLSLT